MTVKIDRPSILVAYRIAEKRILFLDFDGTLVPFSDLPGNSKLDEEVRTIIINLSLDQKNHIYIISGRDRGFLTKQFIGLRVGLIAEHGFRIKESDGNWLPGNPVDNTWKKTVKTLFHEFSNLYPGSFTEEKESSIAYHYRTAGKKAGSKVISVIRKEFLILKQQYPGLELLDGNKVVEIKPSNYNKGRIASAILRAGNFDFIMAAGDDLTDESLFSEIAPGSFTIKIGHSLTCARYYIRDQKKFIKFLKELAQEVN